MFWEWDIGERKRFGSEFPRLSFGQARRVWSEMEQVFFAHYEDFLRVWPEWGSSGIWSIPYPGSRNAGKMVDYSLLPLPDALVGRFKAWQAEFESVPPGSDEGLDDAFFAVADGLARDLKQCVGPSVYVERRELVEIMMDGTARSCRPLLGLPEGE